jgi:hypothetical protein
LPILPPLSTGLPPWRTLVLAGAVRYCCAWPSFRHFQEAIMNEEALNVSVRKFLKKVGVTSQREIEQAVRAAVSGGKLKGNETLPARAMLKIEGLGLAVEIEGAVELE